MININDYKVDTFDAVQTATLKGYEVEKPPVIAVFNMTVSSGIVHHYLKGIIDMTHMECIMLMEATSMLSMYQLTSSEYIEIINAKIKDLF